MPKQEINTFAQGWYAILPGKQLGDKPLAVQRFGLDLVLWRVAGKVYAALDRCPHRGAKLSLGKIKNQCLICPYHGFAFNTDHACELAPEFDKAIPGLRLTHFEVQEALGMLWLRWGSESTALQLGELQQLHDSFSARYSETEKQWNSHITYCIENQLDYTHLKFVHHNTIGRGFTMPKEPGLSFGSEKIEICLRDNRPSLSFYYPNTWVLHVSDSMKLMLFFAPVDATHTQLYLRAYRSFLVFQPLKSLLDPLFNWSNRLILRQDQRVVASQGQLPSYMASNDVLMRHDKAIRQFREQWQQNIFCYSAE